MKKLVLFLTFFMLFSGSLYADAGERLLESANAMKDILRSQKRISPYIVKKAKAVVVISNFKKVGFFLGAEFGEGVASVKRGDGSWSNPFFVKLKGGSFGWQFGFEKGYLFLIFTSKHSVDTLLKDKFTLGVDASVSVGSFGENFEKSSEANFSAEIFTYRKSDGLFIGVSLKGAVLTRDYDRDIELYGNGFDGIKIVNMNYRVDSYGIKEFYDALLLMGE